MKFVKTLFLSLCVLLLNSGASIAKDGNLEAGQVAAFIGTQSLLEPLSNEMKVAGYPTFFKPRPILMVEKGMPLYVNNVAILKEESSGFYSKMTDIVTGYKSGGEVYFQSAEDWARIGDRVMLAYFADHSSSTDTGYDDMSKRMTPQMMAMLPPESKAQIQGLLEMLKSLQSVSEHDRLLVRQFEDEFLGLLVEMQ